MWQCYGLVGTLVFGERLDSMILDVFSSFNESMILLEDNPVDNVAQTIPLRSIFICAGAGTSLSFIS